MCIRDSVAGPHARLGAACSRPPGRRRHCRDGRQHRVAGFPRARRMPRLRFPHRGRLPELGRAR
eukprot:2157898-Prymnesium_polylepis.1